MKLVLMLMLAAAVSPLGLEELAPQVLAPRSCALFLWERATRTRVLMAVAAPGRVRVMRDGKVRDVAQAAADGAPVMGFAPRARFAEAGLGLAWDLAIVPTEAGGAIVRDGTLTVTGADGGAVVAPVAGLIGCSAG